MTLMHSNLNKIKKCSLVKMKLNLKHLLKNEKKVKFPRILNLMNNSRNRRWI